MIDKGTRNKWQRVRPSPERLRVRIYGSIDAEYRRKGTDYRLIRRMDAVQGKGGILLAPKWHLCKAGVMIHEVQAHADLDAAMVQAEKWIREVNG